MNSPARAIAWEHWRWHRWSLLGILIYLLCVAVLLSILDKTISAEAFRELPAGLSGISLMLMIGSMGLITEFCLGTFTLTLPITTRALVGWHMLYGAATAVLVFVVSGLLVWWPWAGYPSNIGFATLLIGYFGFVPTAAVWWQALVLSFLRLPALRILVYVIAVLVFGATNYVEVWLDAVHLAIQRWPIILGIPFHISLIGVAYLVAVAGTARRRRGDVDVAEWRWLLYGLNKALSWLPRRRQPFTSPQQAQLWFEGWRVPLNLGIDPWTGFLVVPFFLLLSLRHLGEMMPNLLMFGACVCLVLSMVVGGSLAYGGVSYGVKKNGSPVSLPAFAAARPMTTRVWVLAKIKLAALSTLSVWGTMGLAALLWFVISGHFMEAMNAAPWAPLGILRAGWHGLMGDFDEAGRWIVLMLTPAEWARWQMDFVQEYHLPLWAMHLLTVAGLMLITFKLLVENLFIGLTGSSKIALASIIATMSLLIGFTLFARLIYWHLDYQETLVCLSWLFGVAVVVKLFLAGWALRALGRQGLVPAPTLGFLVGGWCLAAVGLFALVYWLVPAESVPIHLMAFGVVLFVPLARIAAAPLALAWNRHR